MKTVTIWICPVGIPCSNLGLSLDAFIQMLHFFPQSLHVNVLIGPPRPPTSELFPVFRTGTWRCTVGFTDEVLQQTTKETWSSLNSTTRAYVCCIRRSWELFNLWKLAGTSLLSNPLSLRSFFNVRDNVSRPYKTTGKIKLFNKFWIIECYG